MARLLFCDYHNMVAILEKGEHNTDFHPMVDFIEASPLKIETTEEGTKILATVNGIVRTISESSLRRNLKLRDEGGISSLPNAELFENLTLVGYNISPNQKFTFQKGQFSHQWKYLIHTIMQCMSPKITGFNEFSSNIATALICLAANRTYNFSKMIFDGLVKNVNNKINQLKERVKQLEEREGVATTNSGDDAPIKGMSMDEGEAATERFSDNTKEMATMLTSMDAATVLASEVVDVPTGSGSIPTASTSAEGSVPTGSEEVPTVSPVFGTATVVTPVTRRKGKEVMVESKTPKKQKVQEQIDAQVARELEEQLEKEDQRRAEQIASVAEIARIHAEEEL
uniref:Synaptobrevin, longin-like domain protein n=1 Tax=Tanacetum cinerariifolium TaxID=118510 RepID=A0A699HPQ2_TANCI|nr:synaptobrevin, longin-like domain protein [Tanacetum cinerariifolium]